MTSSRFSPTIAAVVAAGGALGALARWGIQPLATLAPAPLDPLLAGTFTINVVGSLLLGVLTGWATARRPDHRYLRPFLGTGVLGGFTTFSTVSVQSRALLASGRTGVALGYLTGTLLAAVVAAWAGLALAERAAR